MIIPLLIGLAIIAAIIFIGLRFRMLRQMLVMIGLVLIVVAVVGYFKYQGYQGFMAMKEGMSHMKQTVSTTKATMEDWGSNLDAVGSVRAAKGVDISNELAGMVEDIHFNSGNDVKAGALLLTLRAEDDIAKLQTLQAQEKIASINFERDKKELTVQAVSQAAVDNDAAVLQSARAQVAEQKAIVDKKAIRAPFAGHLGIRNVDLGQYLNAGTAIVTLQQLDPVYLDFTLPQQALSQIKTGQTISVKNDTYPDKKFEGSIAAINPKVDVATRNVQVRAELPNAEHLLLPGMYATAEISMGEAQQYVTLPQTAITYNPYGDTVFIVKTEAQKAAEDKAAAEKAKTDKATEPAGDTDKAPAVKQEAKSDASDALVAVQQFVTLGATRGDQVQILKGVNEGDIVVSAGQLKLQNGAGITVNNSVEPKNDPNPKPQEH